MVSLRSSCRRADLIVEIDRGRTLLGGHAKPAIEVTIGFGVELSGLESETRAPTASACAPFREAIELGLSHGRNAMAIWQDLVADCGFRGSYQTVKRFVRKLRGSQPRSHAA